MKNLMIFLFGAGVGAGGMFLWLHHYIKDEINAEKQINETEKDQSIEQKDTEDTPKEKEGSATVNNMDNAVAERHATRVAYDKIVNTYSTPNNELPQGPTTFVNDTMVNPASLAMPRELDGQFVDNDKGIFEISLEEFEEDKSNEKERLIWFKVDHVMCEENGTVITNPTMLVGSNWLDYVNHWASNTAFVRNGRLCTDYEIYVEEGLYTDEYGPLDPYEEG